MSGFLKFLGFLAIDGTLASANRLSRHNARSPWLRSLPRSMSANRQIVATLSTSVKQHPKMLKVPWKSSWMRRHNLRSHRQPHLPPTRITEMNPAWGKSEARLALPRSRSLLLLDQASCFAIATSTSTATKTRSPPALAF